MNGDIISLRQRIQLDVFDYATLVSALRGYQKPRDRISRLLASGHIIRIKKGLYCFDSALRSNPLSREYVANLIYGPSYVSLSYGLSYHGLIPERVHTVTSVTTERSRDFETEIGVFSYRMLSEHRYDIGADLVESSGTTFLLATPEKAVADTVWCDKRLRNPSPSSLEEYLTDDLRIEAERLGNLDIDRLRSIGAAYSSRKIDSLVECIERIASTTHA